MNIRDLIDIRNLALFDFDRDYTPLINADVKQLFEFSGDFIAIDFWYGVYEDNKGFTLMLINREDSYAWMDGIFDTRKELEARVEHIRETLEKMSLLDESI